MRVSFSIRRALRALLLALALVPGGSGCVADSSIPDGQLGGPIDECPVCKHEGDLACVRVRVTADTPSCLCDGQTKHFCSQACRQAFLADPGRYAER